MKRTIWITLVLLLLCVFVLSACDSGDIHPSNGVTDQTGSNSDVDDSNKEDDSSTACQHTSSNWIIDKDATCKEVGSKHKECTKCEEVLETASIDKLTTHTPVIDSRVEPTFTSTGLTEGLHCGVCGVVIVAQDVIPMIPSKTTLTTTTLALDGRNISGSFSYATEIFNFANDIIVTNNSPWVVSTDSYGMQTVATKIVPLNEGNNIFYIHVTNPDQTVSTYTVNIYRNHLYTVSFNTNGGTGVSTQHVEEGYLAQHPTTTRTGYTFSSWDYDFSSPIRSNITINANWNANENTPYKVEYYLENLDKTDYKLVETEELFGKTDTTAEAEEKVFDHFTFNSSMSVMSDNIAGDGSLVLRVYYTRDTYKIGINITQAATLTGSGIYAYGNSVIACVEAVNIGYVFVGWYSGDELVSEETEYKTEIDKNIEARFGVVPEMQNFEFESTLTTCFITGVKDKLVTEIVILDNEIKIADGAFAGCVSLKDLTLPYLEGSLGRIFGTSNYGLTEETYKQSVSGSNISYTIPSSLENVTVLSGTIGYQALNSLNIKTITLGGNVKGISCGSSAGGPSIYMTPYLEEFIVDENNPYYKSIDGNLYTKDGETFLQYARGKNETIFVIPEGVKYIEDTACAYYCKFKTIVIPSTVKTICNEAFSGCDELTKVLYTGKEKEWEEIDITNGFWGGDNTFISKPRYYYSEQSPTDEGNYWHYNDNGEIVDW